MNEQFFAWILEIPLGGVEVKTAKHGVEVTFSWLSFEKKRIMVTIVGGSSTCFLPERIATDGLAWIDNQIRYILDHPEEYS